jgi:hypothetical protein
MCVPLNNLEKGQQERSWVDKYRTGSGSDRVEHATGLDQAIGFYVCFF